MKNKHAVALGKKGGKKRAKNMSAEARSKSAKKAAAARWKSVSYAIDLGKSARKGEAVVDKEFGVQVVDGKGAQRRYGVAEYGLFNKDWPEGRVVERVFYKKPITQHMKVSRKKNAQPKQEGTK